MKWIRSIFGVRRHSESSRRSSPPVRQAPPSAPRPLFVENEEAESPVDLTRELEIGAFNAPSLEDLLTDLRAFALDLERGSERAGMAELQNTLRTAGLRIPPMPQAVIRVQRLIDSPNCNVIELGREIELDPAIATKVVGIGNSPFYGGLEPVRSVRDALVRIGLRETRNIAMAITLHSKVFRVPGFDQEIQRLWKHALAASIAAQLLAAESARDPDPAFLVGLVHDVGRVVLLSLLGDVQRRSRGRAMLLPETVGRLGDKLHAKLGAVAADSWRFSEELVAAIAYHHDPASAPDSARGLAEVLAAADVMAHRIAVDDLTPAPPEEDWARVLEPLGLEPDETLAIDEEAREAFEALGKVF